MDDEQKNNELFDQWAIVELFGRQVIAGRVTEATIGGCSFIRVDVPENDGIAAFTRFFGNGAIYAITPTSEQVARIAIARFRPAPINVYIPEIRQLGPGLEESDDDDF